MLSKIIFPAISLGLIAGSARASDGKVLFFTLKEQASANHEIFSPAKIYKTEERSYHIALESVSISWAGGIRCLYGPLKPEKVYEGHYVQTLSNQFKCYFDDHLQLVDEVESPFVCHEEICMSPGIGVGNLSVDIDSSEWSYVPGLEYPQSVDYRINYRITDFR